MDTTERIAIHEEGDVVIVDCLVKKLDDEELIDHWGDEILDYVNRMQKKLLIIDFKNVSVMTSSAIRHLVFLRHKTMKKFIHFAVCGLNENNMEIFTMTCLASKFVIGKDVPEALELLRQ